MPIKLYADHHVDIAIIKGLRNQGVDILTAREDQADRLEDPALLDRASELKRVLFTQDKDFLVECSKRQKLDIHFYGVIFGKQKKVLIGIYIENLHYLAKVGVAEDFENRLYYLPL